MLQDFDRRTTPETGAARLAQLRSAMAAAGVEAFLVPRSDAHQGENVAPRDERLAWLTGFTGSAGSAVVTAGDAAIFVDGRYRLQVRDQVDLDCFEVLNHPEDKLAPWLAARLSGAGKVGFDPWLHTAAEIERLSGDLDSSGAKLARVENLVDRIWNAQPPPPERPVVVHPVALAGRSSEDKRTVLAADLREAGLAAAVLSLPDSIAWLLNIRGSDVARVPVALAFAILYADARVELFLDPDRCDPEVRAHLGPQVALIAPEDFGARIDALKGQVAVDKASAPVWISDRLKAAGGAEVVWRRDPCILPKACKTEAERQGARAAHLRDGAAVATFLAWCDETLAGGGVSEIDAVRRLEAIRLATGALQDLAFDTICGSGPNGAIVHYRVTRDSDRRIVPDSVLLVDSGGQYCDGTTDITRTIAVSDAQAARRPFTLVLKGLIALSRLRWPAGLAGRDLDAVARAALWRAGFDYDHGTGHGIGSYLSVHEGPQGISRRATEPLQPGMIVSIEPGYYREGAFGIRIENLAIVREAEVPEGGERPMLGFETLTLAPIDRRLIAGELLDPDERSWLDGYHARVAGEIAPRVGAGTAQWLRCACAPL